MRQTKILYKMYPNQQTLVQEVCRREKGASQGDDENTCYKLVKCSGLFFSSEYMPKGFVKLKIKRKTMYRITK